MPVFAPERLGLLPLSMTTGLYGEMAIIDERRMELVIMSADGKTIKRLSIPRLRRDTVVLAGPEGGGFVMIHDDVMLSMDNQLRPLLKPEDGWGKFLFLQKAGEKMQSVSGSRAFHCYPNGDISFIRYSTLTNMRRHAIAPIARHMKEETD